MAGTDAIPEERAGLPVRTFATAGDWAAWLAAEHATANGVWVRFAKKGSGHASVTFPEALDEALCWGWIDGQRNGLDTEWYLQKFTPRRARSTWSKVNREKVAMLIAAGRMQPPGQREIDRAKADGRWDAAYDGARTMTVPDDLQAALDADPAAAAFFATLDSQNRYAVLFRIHGAKRPETRARRIAQFVAMLAEGRRIYERPAKPEPAGPAGPASSQPRSRSAEQKRL